MPVSHKAIGRIGGLTRASMYDGAEMTAPARNAAFERFVLQVDPNRELSDEERQRRAIAAQRAHMSKIALKSAAKRSKKVSA
jgi:hypothetical protein